MAFWKAKGGFSVASSAIWVLILFISADNTGGVGVASTEFLSQAACENGLADIEQQANRHPWDIAVVDGVCVLKGQP